MNRNMMRSAIMGIRLPNEETVTFRSRPAEDTEAFNDYTVHRCSRRGQAGSLGTGGVVAAGERTRWTMRKGSLDAAGAPGPKVTDIIVDSAGNPWVVQSYEIFAAGQAWHLDCCVTGAMN